MKKETKGWIIINECHPRGGNKMIIESSFAWTRKESIEKFLVGVSDPWKYWRDTMNYKCVKAKRTTEIITP